MQIVGELWKIPNQIRTDLESIESLDPAPFTHVVVNFEKVLSWLVLDSDALGIINNMPPGLESSLGMISAYLNVSCPEASLSEDSLDELMESVSQLMDDVKAANLDGNFTDFFLHRLDELHYALNHYNTLGPDEVLRKVDELFGSMLRQYPSIQRSPKKQDIAKKVFKIGTAILLAIQIVNGGFELAVNYQQFIAISHHENSDSQTTPPASTNDT